MGFELKVVDNSGRITEQFEQFLYAGLEKVGLMAEEYAAALTPVGTPESTGIIGYIGGTLRQSMTHKVAGTEVYVGSNIEYAPYVEWGTGVYVEDAEGNKTGTGRQTPWAWVDKNGDVHWTNGMKPHHMILKAITEHDAEYEAALRNSFQF